MEIIPKQKIMKILGEYGCYFLSIIYLAEEISQTHVDIIEEFIRARTVNSIDDSATVLNPEEILTYLTEKKCSVRKENKDYCTKDNEYEILVFKDKYTHFVVGNNKPLIDSGYKNVKYDPLGNSNTVKNGYVESKRIFKII